MIGLFVLWVLLIVLGTFTQTDTSAFDEPITIDRLHALTNEKRKDAGVPELVLDERLNKSALAKCTDMADKDYFAHYSPDGVQPWFFMKQQYIPYATAGENLANGSKANPSDITDRWYASTAHRENLLNQGFTHVGYGVCDRGDGYYLTVQHFISQ